MKLSDDPSTRTLILIGIVFLFFIITLSIFPPSWVKGINNTTNKKYIRWKMVLLYSSIFSIAIGICGLFIFVKIRGPLKPIETKYANEQA